MFAPNPARDSALIDLELFGGDLLRPEVGNEVLIKAVHDAPPYGISHILNYGNNCLQPYGCSRNTSRMEFKDRLKAARKHAKLNQGELATLAGLTQTSISDLERGKSKGSSFSAQIASVCGVSVMWLVTGSGEMLGRTGVGDGAEINSDRNSGNALAHRSFQLIDHGATQIGQEAGELAMLASPRSQAALKRIAQAADSGRLTETDVVLLEKIAERIAGTQQPGKEGANARIARKIKNAPKDSD